MAALGREKSGRSELSYVNSLTPTAELRPLERTQTDEKDLMPYSVIVEIERLAIRDKRSPIDIFLILKDELELEEALLKDYIKKNSSDFGPETNGRESD